MDCFKGRGHTFKFNKCSGVRYEAKGDMLGGRGGPKASILQVYGVSGVGWLSIGDPSTNLVFFEKAISY